MIQELQAEDNTFDTQWAAARNEIMNDLINRTTKTDEQYINYKDVKGNIGSNKEYCTRVGNVEIKQTADEIEMKFREERP